MNEITTNQHEEVMPDENAVEVPAEEEQSVASISEPEVKVTEVVEEECPNDDNPSKESTDASKKKFKLSKKNALFIVCGVVFVAIITFVILFFAVIRPNSIYNNAVSALERGDFAQCEQLLKQIPNHEGTYELSQKATLANAKSYIDEGELDIADSLLMTLTSNEEAKLLREDILYLRAVDLVNHKDYDEATIILAQIPNHKGAYELSQKATIAKAQSYIDEGELDIADSLLVTLISNEEAKLLRQDIQYLRAVDLVNHKDYDEATIILDKIPNHEDPEQLREQISYATAMESLEAGDYKTAYEHFSQLGDYEDSATQKEIVYYEALAFKSLFNIQSTLKNPASMYVKKVTFYKDSSNKNELDAIFEFNATNSYGGSLGAYGYDLALYDGDDDSGMISHSAYVDPDDYIDYLTQLIIDGIKKQTVMETTVDIARMNRLISGNASFNIDLPFQSAEIVDS